MQRYCCRSALKNHRKQSKVIFAQKGVVHMKAAVLEKPNTLCYKEIPRPAANDEFMVVEVKACGICGSDVRYYKGENPWALHTLGKNLPNPPNIVLGHEWAGVVREAANPKYMEWIGRRVAVLAFKSCGICDDCRSGNYHLCRKTAHIGHGAGWGKMEYYPGGMAEFCQIWNTNVCELPDKVSFEEATISDPLSVAIHAISLSGIEGGDNVLVLGTGPVGLCIGQAVSAYGADKVICTDIIDYSLELAVELGIDDVVDAKKETVTEVLKRHGLEKVRIIFDTVGTKETQRMALSVLKESGTLVNLVMNHTKVHYQLLDIAGERRIISSANNRTEDFIMGIKLIENGIVNAKKMITQTFTLKDVQKGFDVMLAKDTDRVMKVVITP